MYKKGWSLNSSVETTVLNLILEASLFTKSILVILLMISTISWAIILHKYLYIRKYRSEITRFLKSLTSQSSPAMIEDSCTHFSKGVTRTMPVLLLKIFRIKKQGKIIQSPEAIINNASMHEMNKLQRGMGMLATTANVSPLLGLLGTVWGIMYAFINISQKGGASIDVVAPGIAEALITTIVGLCVAIPALVGHNLLSGVIDQCMDNLDRISEYAASVLSQESTP